MTAGDGNQRVGSGAGSAAPCEALGLLPVLVEAQQVPVTSPRAGNHPDSVDLPVLDVSPQWGHTLCVLLCLTSLAEHRVLRVHPSGSECQGFTPLRGSGPEKRQTNKVTLPATLVTAGAENQRLDSWAGSAAACEALGLLPVSVEAQQVPVTSPSIVFSGCIHVAASVRASHLCMAEGLKKDKRKERHIACESGDRRC
ncbi:hypothetical protein J1605_018018 [Eschrichtius robustus]|uniref:Uncharacterized protein n=1 Tax=Eschrichtius robustus TaxID=9764 RepID=A0AB34HYA8_ESCRO|nr:hypothetical protein J1605_018018 [Eschrichtius robustus]